MDSPPVLDAVSGDDEARRLAECIKEPIRTPGRIQSHGVLLGVERASGLIRIVSDNAAGWIGRRVAEVGSDTLDEALAATNAVDPQRVRFGGADFDVIVHPAGDLALVELESALPDFAYARTSVVGALQRLSTITDAAELRQATADEIRCITGFDRVMVYHFHDDGHGEVVAESRVDEMEPYRGLHFPTSDIPLQARELYLRKRSRAIVSTTDPGSVLLALEGHDPQRLDLSDSELRSVSPHHLQFMRNMGQASTVSLSLVGDGRLIGMITCAHRTERRLPVLLRRALEVLAGQLAMQLTNLGEIDRLRHTLAVRERRTALLAPLYGSDDIAAALLGGDPTVLDLVPADAVAVRVAGVTRTAGAVPDGAQLDAAFRAIAGEAVASEALPAERPGLAALLPGIAGLLSVPLGADDDALLFLRGEVTRVVDWLGDQSESNRVDRLAPRLSFSAWRQSVSGTSLPWGVVRAEAAELGVELQGALARRAEAKLAALALRDPLTGLHNRRSLEQRLASLAARSELDEVALLFLDLDDFKSINDTHGHDVGDAVLAEIATRLTQHARADDLVVRLGGDEFVVLAVGVDTEAAGALAHRTVDALRAPLAVGDLALEVTGSCGVVTASTPAALVRLLDDADAAMYRASR